METTLNSDTFFPGLVSLWKLFLDASHSIKLLQNHFFVSHENILYDQLDNWKTQEPIMFLFGVPLQSIH